MENAEYKDYQMVSHYFSENTNNIIQKLHNVFLQRKNLKMMEYFSYLQKKLKIYKKLPKSGSTKKKRKEILEEKHKRGTIRFGEK